MSEQMRQNVVLLDGAMGTMLQDAGLKPGSRPETLSITSPESIERIHRQYIAAGAKMILANTFCANAHKLSGTGYTTEEVVHASVRAALRAAKDTEAVVALDIGPIGELLEPLGTLSFDEAYELFAQMIRAGVRAGAQAVFFETFADLGELRAGVLAAKECCSLPVYASMTFESTGRTFLGCRAEAAAMTLTGLGVHALGVNCSLGPVEAAPILRAMRAYTDLPLIFKPNAGLPDPLTGQYGAEPEAFARACEALLDCGAVYIGGCCGTTPAHIAALGNLLDGKEAYWKGNARTGVCSAARVCPFDGQIKVIGERINPTGKKRMKQALLEGDMAYLVTQAIEQEEAGAQILDVNVGLPGIDEADVMRRAVLAISAAVDLPLQLDSSNPAVIEAGLRIAPGKCLINSVNATKASLESILPLARKYGAALVGLTIGENGLAKDADERVMLARKILDAAERAGISPSDVAIDCLTLTVSAQQDQAQQTLEALDRIRKELGLETVLGVSNISFGLPQRDVVTGAFLAQAIACGLTMPIVNPNNPYVMDMLSACRIMKGEDAGCAAYIERFAQMQKPKMESTAPRIGLEEAIVRGMKSEAIDAAKNLLLEMAPLDVVEKHMIPALDRVGGQYEAQKIFLPQLMNAASAASSAFEAIRAAIKESGGEGDGVGPVVLATVEGDIHDIGKNIVRTVLESYGFRVIDLGRDVPAERIVMAVKEHDAKLVGLSALMTTTVPGMRRTIELLRKSGLTTPVIVGGAVLTQEYARTIGADYYAKDAKQCADVAREILC